MYSIVIRVGGFVVFKMWSLLHIVYMVSSFVLFAILYFSVKNKSDKVKYAMGAVLGVISVMILIVRNIDIYYRSGWDLEVVPLQVCHIGSLVAGLALILKKKWLLVTSFCFNMIPAFLAMVFADSLANYDTLLKIRPQTYIWGHIFIVVCALYGILVYLPKFTKRDLRNSICFVLVMAVSAILCNSLFREWFSWEPNYFYLYDYKGTPLKFLYNVMDSSSYGWFTINWFYVIVLLSFFLLVFLFMYYVATIIVKKINVRK